MSVNQHIPKFGFGTAYKISETEETEEDRVSRQSFLSLIQRALEIGVRHIDCAPLYGTQELVGQAICKSGIPREELFIVSKLAANRMRPERIEKAIHDTLKELQTDYLDLYLIHAPFSTKYTADSVVYPFDARGKLIIDDETGLLESSWRKMAELKERGLARFIGVSNFNLTQLERLNSIHHVDVLQNEYHLYNQERLLIRECERMGIHFEAYAALGCPPLAKVMEKPTFESDPAVTRIAKRRGLSNAQVVILWLNSNPISYVVRSDSIQQLEENLKPLACNIVLMQNDVFRLNCLNRKIRLYHYTNLDGVTLHREYPFKSPITRSSSLP